MTHVTHTLLLAALALLGTLAPRDAAAQSFRCKSDIVSVGDARSAVQQKCGEPVVKDSFCRPIAAPAPPTPPIPPIPSNSTVINVQPCETVDDWVYNPGYGQFMTTLRFESGKLASITYGDRVK